MGLGAFSGEGRDWVIGGGCREHGSLRKTGAEPLTLKEEKT